MSADVDVVIVAYRSRDAIARVVESATRVPGAAQVVVVDNGEDGSASVAAAAGAKVIEQPWNPGFGSGQNAGVRTGSAPYVLMLNPDAELVSEAVDIGTTLLEAEPDVAAVQGAILGRDGQAERSQGRELGPLHLWGRALGARRLLRFRAARSLARHVPQLRDHAERVPPEAADVASLAATVLLVRRAAFEGIGGFDESYFLYGEDLDLCRRLRAAGWRLVALPGAWAHHDSGGSSASWWDRELVWWQGTMTFAARWWTARAWSTALGAAVMRWAVLGLRRPRSAGRVWRALVSQPHRVRRTRTM
jgi:N-acetylglucosaminyl-diphospho-decaprenol L-rhamnosyltransferase